MSVKNMMKKLLPLIALLLALTHIGFAQNLSTQGKDFWLSFLPNHYYNIPTRSKLEILVSSDRNCTGIVSNPKARWSVPFSVTPGLVTSVVVPNDIGQVEKVNSIEEKAIHVTATDTISVFISNLLSCSNDVSNVFPTNMLRDSYLIQGYKSDYAVLSDNIGSKILIVGVENNTKIEIEPRGGIYGKSPKKGIINVTLDKGDCYMVMSSISDVSGTTVHSTNGKKFVAFSGGDAELPFSACRHDAVFEQMPPTAYWGRHFVLTPIGSQKRNIVRITSLSDDCVVKVDGKTLQKLSARQTYEYKLKDYQEPAFLETSSPVLVNIYFASLDGSGGKTVTPNVSYIPSTNRAPVRSMVTINPIEQQINRMTFGTYNAGNIKLHFVNVVVATSNVNGVKMDGKSISSKFKPVKSKPDFSYANVEVEEGSHTLICKEGGFVANVYGWGDSFDEGYAYAIGSKSRELNKIDADGNLAYIIDEREGQAINLPSDTLPNVEFDPVSIESIKKGEAIIGVVKDQDGKILNPEDYDYKIKSENAYLFDSIWVDVRGDSIMIFTRTRGDWCDCFMPNMLKFDVVMTPKAEYDGNGRRQKVVRIEVPIEKEEPWLSRCSWIFIVLAFLSLLIIYLRALLRKNRFKKNAMITPRYYSYYGDLIDDQGGCKLRREGFGPWLQRWLLPGNERTTLSFDKPLVSGLTLIATESEEVVNIPKSCCNWETMTIDNYDPESDTSKKKTVTLGNNGIVEITDYNGKPDGTLMFTSGNDSDGVVYRILLGLILTSVLLAMAVLIVLIIRTL